MQKRYCVQNECCEAICHVYWCPKSPDYKPPQKSLSWKQKAVMVVAVAITWIVLGQFL